MSQIISNSAPILPEFKPNDVLTAEQLNLLSNGINFNYETSKKQAGQIASQNERLAPLFQTGQRDSFLINKNGQVGLEPMPVITASINLITLKPNTYIVHGIGLQLFYGSKSNADQFIDLANGSIVIVGGKEVLNDYPEITTPITFQKTFQVINANSQPTTDAPNTKDNFIFGSVFFTISRPTSEITYEAKVDIIRMTDKKEILQVLESGTEGVSGIITLKGDANLWDLKPGAYLSAPAQRASKLAYSSKDTGKFVALQTNCIILISGKDIKTSSLKKSRTALIIRHALGSISSPIILQCTYEYKDKIIDKEIIAKYEMSTYIGHTSTDEINYFIPTEAAIVDYVSKNTDLIFNFIVNEQDMTITANIEYQTVVEAAKQGRRVVGRLVDTSGNLLDRMPPYLTLNTSQGLAPLRFLSDYDLYEDSQGNLQCDFLALSWDAQGGITPEVPAKMIQFLKGDVK